MKQEQGIPLMILILIPPIMPLIPHLIHILILKRSRVLLILQILLKHLMRLTSHFSLHPHTTWIGSLSVFMELCFFLAMKVHRTSKIL